MSPKDHDIENPLTQLPDRAYAARVLARQGPYALVIAALFLPVALIVGVAQKNDYSSYVAALYDNRDSAEWIPRYPLYPRFAQVAESFHEKMADPEFLWKVGQAAGLTHVRPGQTPVSSWIRSHLPLGSTFFAMGNEHELLDDPATRSSFASWLKKRLSANFDEKKDTLSLLATYSDPVTARRLAAVAMELFIQSELRFETETVQREHELYSGFLQEAAHADSADKQAGAAKKAGVLDKAATAKSDELRLKDREQELLERVAQVKGEIDAVRGRATSQRATLEGELARLTTKLQPSHPDVIAKEAELRAFDRGKSDSEIESLRGKLGGLRETLGAVHAEMRKLGLSVVQGELPDAAVASRGQFLPNLADRVGELRVESERMAKQVEAPELRTRLRVFVPATYDEVPAARNRDNTMVGLALLGALAGVGAGALRELRCPLARDGWRIALHAKAPILTELTKASLKRYPSISPQLAGIMRESAMAKTERRGAAGEVLYAYRRLELELRRRLKGNVILVLDASANDRSGPFLNNFLNIRGVEAAGVQLVIDCDRQDPVVPPDERLASHGDLGAFLSGRAPWKDVRLARTGERAFDLVPPGTGAEGDHRAYKTETLIKLFDGLGRSYARVYVRGHDPRQVFENAALAQAATDVILCIDGRQAGFADLDRALALAPPEKLRGLVLLGT